MSEGQVKPIALDELPRFSRWPAILLGAKAFPAKTRTKEEVLREYDREKWGAVLEWLRSNDKHSSEDLLAQQGLPPESEIAFAIGTEFFAGPALHVMRAYEDLLVKALSGHRRDTLVELGCGLGDKVLHLAAHLKAKTVFGGEFTASGVECGRLLAKRRGIAATFERFDYNDPSTLAGVPKGALVYTSHSIEQIPRLQESFIAGVIEREPAIVFHFEPCFEDHEEGSLVGLMRRRYAELNDYNRNLVGLLRAFERQGRVRILRHEKNLFSDTPFNPTSIIAWEPAR